MQIEIMAILDQINNRLDSIERNAFREQREHLTFKEAAAYLGIPEPTLYGYVHKGIIKHYKLNNRRLYFKRSELDEFIFSENNRVK